MDIPWTCDWRKLGGRTAEGEVNQHTGRRLSPGTRFHDPQAARFRRDPLHRRERGEQLENRGLNCRGRAKRGNLERDGLSIMRVPVAKDLICQRAVTVNVGIMRHVPVNYGSECERAARM